LNFKGEVEKVRKLEFILVLIVKRRHFIKKLFKIAKKYFKCAQKFTRAGGEN